MQYVPYDTGVWGGFTSYIKSVIGVSVNIGIIILACILGVLVAIAIVRKFSR